MTRVLVLRRIATWILCRSDFPIDRPGSNLPPIFKIGQPVCTILGLSPGERFQVEAISGAWLQVRGVGGATKPYWIKP